MCLPGLSCPVNGVRPMAPMSLRSMKRSAPDDVGGDLDPAEVVLLGQRDVDVDQLVRARADRAAPPPSTPSIPGSGAPASTPESPCQGVVAERARPLVIEVDRRPLRLRVDDHQPLGLDVGQHGRRRRRAAGVAARRARARRAFPPGRPRARAPRPGRRRRRGRPAAGGVPERRARRSRRRGDRRRRSRRRREQLADHVQAKPDLRGVAGVGILLQVALEVLLGLVELLRLLVGDGDVEEKRRVTASCCKPPGTSRRRCRTRPCTKKVCAVSKASLASFRALSGVASSPFGARHPGSRERCCDDTAAASTRAADREHTLVIGLRLEGRRRPLSRDTRARAIRCTRRFRRRCLHAPQLERPCGLCRAPRRWRAYVLASLRRAIFAAAPPKVRSLVIV